MQLFGSGFSSYYDSLTDNVPFCSAQPQHSKRWLYITLCHVKQNVNTVIQLERQRQTAGLEENK